MSDSLGNRLLIIFCCLLFVNIYFYYNDTTKGEFPTFQSSSDGNILNAGSKLQPFQGQKVPSFSASYAGVRNIQDAFHYSQCTSIFRTYVYSLTENEASENARSLHKWFRSSTYNVEDPKNACIFLVISEKRNDSLFLLTLEHWKANGANHLVVFAGSPAPIQRSETWNAIFVSSHFYTDQFSAMMDLNAFIEVPDYNKTAWTNFTAIAEDNKEFLLSFISPSGILSKQKSEVLEKCDDDCLLDLSCASEGPSDLCSNSLYRTKVGLSSTFSLILSSFASAQQRIFEALKCNSIPVIVGSQSVSNLPFGDFIDWNRAAIRLPRGRLADLVSILKQVPSQTILDMRRNGRFYMDHFLGDAKVLSRAILTAIRLRVGLSAPPETEAAPKVSVLLTSSPNTSASNPDDSTLIRSRDYKPCEDTHKLWNHDPSFLDATQMIPLVTVPLIPGVEKIQPHLLEMINLEREPKFGLTLSGNHPPEMFTIVMLAYKRDEQLHFTLKEMNGLMFLKSVIVIWNDISRTPPVDWPRIHVPIHVVNASQNSLNNRFLPLDLIDTEAVFNMDDDFNVNHEDMLFSFRVWRENRDVIVGPNFRLGYVKDGNGVYVANAQCQYNMVLTSGAFIHRSYLRAYTYEMPEVIREHIDVKKNCEDIAVNFLISHLTRKAPIKTTPITNTRGKFSPQGLSTRGGHYKERADCIGFFIQVFGYNPLIISEFRADSVLYQMHSGKCFKNT
ncbi:glycosyl transferase family 64 domain-containing protein [Ditylenchus destructor]|uniref:Glycosyl transferase family 64 domain-containing protein n=1 Tax=Ditylenchus destructor TaxID=166010 RepID=A0AAD4R832_9BILA|nr:glycosyl transferase family 64 domain-containing protein [Ditylenchus destructor]